MRNIKIHDNCSIHFEYEERGRKYETGDVVWLKQVDGRLCLLHIQLDDENMEARYDETCTVCTVDYSTRRYRMAGVNTLDGRKGHFDLETTTLSFLKR